MTKMSSNDCQYQNILSYTRKTYKKHRTETSEEPANCSRPQTCDLLENSPRSDVHGCSCDLERDNSIVNILHKKCPVISLAQRQLNKLIDETDRLLVEHSQSPWYRPTCKFLEVCKQILNENGCTCAALGAVIVVMSFITGMIFGAASCGYKNRHFNSPILHCIENMFTPDTYPTIEENFHSII